MLHSEICLRIMVAGIRSSFRNTDTSAGNECSCCCTGCGETIAYLTAA